TPPDSRQTLAVLNLVIKLFSWGMAAYAFVGMLFGGVDGRLRDVTGALPNPQRTVRRHSCPSIPAVPVCGSGAGRLQLTATGVGHNKFSADSSCQSSETAMRGPGTRGRMA